MAPRKEFEASVLVLTCHGRFEQAFHRGVCVRGHDLMDQAQVLLPDCATGTAAFWPIPKSLFVDIPGAPVRDSFCLHTGKGWYYRANMRR